MKTNQHAPIVSFTIGIGKDTFSVSKILFVIALVLSSIAPLVPSRSVSKIVFVFAFVEILLREKETTAVSFFAAVFPKSFMNAFAVIVRQASDTVRASARVDNARVQTATIQLVRDGLVNDGSTTRIVPERGCDRRRRLKPSAQELRIAFALGNGLLIG